MFTEKFLTPSLTVLLLLCSVLTFAQSVGLHYIPVPTDENFTIGQSEISPAASIDFLDDLEDIFDEPEYFEEGSSVIQFGAGMYATVNIAERAAELDQVDTKLLMPGVHLMYERQLAQNIGIGLSLGAQIWKVPVLNYQYRYYTAGLRAAYHLNILEKLDPYFGIAGTYRTVVLTNKNRNESNGKVTAHFIGGARYYFSEKIGAYFEFGNDMTGKLKLGVAFYFS